MALAPGSVAETVLAVDDQAVNRALLAGILRPQYRVIEAASGEEALAVLEREPVDLVLLDVMMPGIDGIETCARIKARAAAPYLPVILLTALNDQPMRNAGLNAGADDFIAKPFDRLELLLRARTFVRLRRQDSRMKGQVEDLRKLQQAKDDLVSMLIHDLRSPLSGVDALLQLLEQDLATPELAAQRGDVLQAQRSMRAVLEMLEEMLQTRLVEEGRLPVRRDAVDVGALVAEVVAAASGLARKRGIAVTSSAETLGTALVDGKLVRRALENLLSNALKHTGEEGDVVVDARRDGAVLQLEVADRGPGIPDSAKASLFQKFSSLEADRGEARQGVGLGLYLVQLVASGHGGSIDVVPRPGGGSVFRLRLDAGVS